ncbi:TRAP transporter small permease [Alkalicoccobacillus murimartini]|uniref:TRAP-type C4-dicarboxylate transport system permease small subunit n=1 Tax=Alkalicoccobacillus murimartini TaxID=171685 RepID=A0ABT9YHY1_9BACI|nr:TRAP transporter small permease [Alkalicoccobacillus murimartini]MDQ0207208.1 TRAP-type C4-dicarboxylate transport system permease small subunit [Alkalicoccobacillus murimartini]
MERIKSVIDRIIIGFSSVLVVFLVVGAIWQVFTRFVLQNPSVFTEEVLRFSLIWIGFLGASYAFGHREHLALTFLTSRFEGRKKRVSNLVIDSSILVFAVLVFVVGGSRLVLETLNQVSPVLGLPMGVVYGVLPLAGVLIIFYQVLNMKIDAAKLANEKREAA